jgi:uncharacterized protein (TIGR00375 family)
MNFIADLHVHSYLSRATSRQMNLENLHKWAQLKGVTVVGTGDFTHPRWFAELQEKLEPAEPGLFRLKDEYCSDAGKEVPESCRGPVRFMLSVEISTIYKKRDRTRKVHSLILSPDLLSAGRLNATLQEAGNIKSDGRPIIGMDCKTLLQLTLDASRENSFIPAHIWTPHFSVLGAASGFDSIEDCFEELTPNIFALETGLSSDPPMNWMLSGLDRFVLVSNSDAHSPSKLAREANIFTCGLSYFEMMKALREKDWEGFKGTIEFFPEEGKYHYDGHRACKMRMSPDETISNEGRCPECGKKVTVGVMHRVKVLSDRNSGFKPEGAFGFESLVPLVEILSEIHGVGVNSKKISHEYRRLLERFGSELHILRDCPLSDLKQAGHQILAEAIRKIREGRVDVNPGYDGEYGTVRIFEPGEMQKNQLSLF